MGLLLISVQISKKSPLKAAKHITVNPVYPASSGSNPFENAPVGQNTSTNPFDDGQGEEKYSSYSYKTTLTERNKYKNDFRDTGGVENQSVEELENYAVYKAEETTKSVNGCLKIAEEIREDATKTLVTLHQQGNKSLGPTWSLQTLIRILVGKSWGIFSKTWKPKKTRPISGPVITGDNAVRRGGQLEEREKLGLTSAPKGRSTPQTLPPGPVNALQKVELEKAKQDDGLSDLSDLLGELKDMAVDMGSEIERHNKALGHLYDDVDELNVRVRGANQRGRRLLGIEYRVVDAFLERPDNPDLWIWMETR
ncbi:soluble N-ethylmaleimide-sensitive factor adaptor protein 33 [Prunus dulcis]|uniref:Soluble N-ethylmaleimide-sensitive factor adaptor protein 33 n=1 Tax=Prunus dulcis TaxID=3755 RepID=A0A4Y1RJX1_PRUDU|nr:soluble N-ethylmaleimide-sensitive factor adaptor protein 33 [Prunus dulcis]